MVESGSSGSEEITCFRCGTHNLRTTSTFQLCSQCETQIRPRSLEAPRFLLDNNILDHLIEPPELIRRVITAHESGHVEFLMTSIQHDEMMKVPDSEKRSAMAVIPFVITQAYGVVPGVSKPGLARFGETELIDVVRSPEGNHTEDALHATTAKYEDAVLVTEDQRLTRRARELGVEVWDAQRLIEYIETLGQQTWPSTRSSSIKSTRPRGTNP
jgi:rRNA-processing protein FCF1